MAFFRGYLECISIPTLTERYLEFGKEDEAKGKKVLNWMIEELVAAAKRSSRYSMVRALQIPPQKLLPSPSDEDAYNPTLEEFADEYDPTGFYSEKELIELLQKTIKQKTGGSSHSAEVKERLRRRQITAVNILESELVEIPRLSDPLIVWIDDAIAERLAKAHIYTLQDMVTTIQKRGRRWWVNVPRLGKIGAENIHRWLLHQEAHLGIDLDDAIKLSHKERVKKNALARPMQFGLVPIEYLALPDELSGYLGQNRGVEPLISASNDIEAIHAWLGHIALASKHTLKNYRKEAERFWLWCLLERRKPLSSVVGEDCTNYLCFIDALDLYSEWSWHHPREFWIGKKKPRADPEWKPFAGPLSKASQKQAKIVIMAMFEWLTRARYLSTNPWDIIAKTKFQPALKTGHALTIPQLKLIFAECEAIEDPLRKSRLQFVLQLACTTGLRLTEITSLKAGHLNQDGKTLYVLGKGDRERNVPITSGTMNALHKYMTTRGFEAHEYIGSKANPVIPLVATITEDKTHYDKRLQETLRALGLEKTVEGEAQIPQEYLARRVENGILEKSIYELLQRHFKKVASKTSDLLDEARIKHATTHWLRHSFATNAIEAGEEIQVVQAVMGHASINTTMLYLTENKKKQIAAADLVERLLDE